MEDLLEEFSVLEKCTNEIKKYKIYLASAIISITLTAAVFIAFMITLLTLDTALTGTVILQWILLFALPAAILIFLSVFTFKKMHKCALEYDYTFTDGMFTIAEINNRVRRSEILKTDNKSIARIGIAEGESFIKIKESPNTEIIKAYSGNSPVNSEHITYIMMSEGESKSVYLVDVSKKFMRELTRGISNYVFADRETENDILR